MFSVKELVDELTEALSGEVGVVNTLALRVILTSLLKIYLDEIGKVVMEAEPVNGWGNDSPLNRAWADGFQNGKLEAQKAVLRLKGT